MMKLKIKRNTS